MFFPGTLGCRRLLRQGLALTAVARQSGVAGRGVRGRLSPIAGPSLLVLPPIQTRRKREGRREPRRDSAMLGHRDLTKRIIRLAIELPVPRLAARTRHRPPCGAGLKMTPGLGWALSGRRASSHDRFTAIRTFNRRVRLATWTCASWSTARANPLRPAFLALGCQGVLDHNCLKSRVMRICAIV